MALRMELELSQAAPKPDAERTRNSRRRMVLLRIVAPRMRLHQGGWGGKGSGRRGLAKFAAPQNLNFESQTPQMRNGAASRRKGSVMARKITSRTPWTATPRIRNGSKSSQMNGYAIRASRARGQQRTKRMHHSRNANMAETSFSL